MGDITVVSAQGINGEHAAARAARRERAAGRDDPDGHRRQKAMRQRRRLRSARADMARTVLALLLTPPAAVPIEFSYAGEAEAADGRADVIDAKGPGSFAVRLFLDKATHRPLMLAYKGVAPQMRIMTQRGGAPPAGTPDEKHGEPGSGGAAPQIVDISMFLDDYKREGGRLASASRVAIDRRQAGRRMDAHLIQSEPRVQARHIRREVTSHGFTTGRHVPCGRPGSRVAGTAGAGPRGTAAARCDAPRHGRRSERRGDHRRARDGGASRRRSVNRYGGEHGRARHRRVRRARAGALRDSRGIRRIRATGCPRHPHRDRATTRAR